MGRLIDELREKLPKMAEQAKRSPAKAIRLFCLECMGGSPADVKRCEVITCPLHPFRFGKRPSADPGEDNGDA